MCSANRKKGFMWNTLGSAMYGVNSFVMLAMASRVGTVEEAGAFGIAFTTAQLLYFIGLFGVPHYQMTDYGETYSFGSYVKARVFSGILMLLCSIGSVVLMGFTGIKRAYTFALTLLMLVNVVGELFQSLFFQKNRLDLSGSALFFRTLWPLILFCAVALLTGNVFLAVLVQTASNLVITVYYGVRIAPKFITKSIAETRKADTAANVLRECLPLAVSLLLMNIVINSSKYGIEFCLDDPAQGYFNMIFMPAQVINLCSQFLFKPFLNQYATFVSQKRNADFLKILCKQLLIIAAFTAFCCVCAYYLGIHVLGFIYKKDLSSLEWPLTLIILGGGLFAVCDLFYYILVIMRVQKGIFAVYIGATIGSLLLSFVFISRHGILGAAYSFVITHALILFAFILLIVGFLSKQRLSGQQ